MKTLNLYLTFILILGLSLNAFTQSWQFAKSFGGVPGSNIYHYENNKPHCMEVDNEGNTYMFGTYGALTQINGSTLPYYGDGSSGSFIVKYNCAGEVLWHKAIANTQNTDDKAFYMTINDNHLYIMGTVHIEGYSKIWWIDTLVQGFNIPYPYEYPWIPHRCYNYVIKMDLDGNIEDIHRLRFEIGELQKNKTLANRSYLYYFTDNKVPFTMDNEGNFYTFAYFDNTYSYYILEVDNEIVSDTIYPTFKWNHLLLKFDADFNLQWYKPVEQGFTGDSLKFCKFNFYEMKFDNNNNAYLVGNLYTYSDTEPDTTHTDVSLGNGQTLTTYGMMY